MTSGSDSPVGDWKSRVRHAGGCSSTRDTGVGKAACSPVPIFDKEVVRSSDALVG